MFSWAEVCSASALPFSLGDELKQDLVSASALPFSLGDELKQDLVSASALPFLLDEELKQDLASSSRSTMTYGGASIPKRMRPFAACTTVTRMDSPIRMLSPTFRERTSMIEPSMML